MTTPIKEETPQSRCLTVYTRSKTKKTVPILVSNYTNKHITFTKGEYVGQFEPSTIEDPTIDDTEASSPDDNGPVTHSTNSIAQKKMLAERVYPDTFEPSHHTLSLRIQHKLDALLLKYKSQFAQDETSIGTTPLTSMTIDTGNSPPVSQRPYPVAMKNHQWVKGEIEKLLEANVISSSWTAPIIVIPKGDGGKHLVIDYRALNKVTRKFTWPMPKVEDIFAKLNGAKYFTTLDLRAGYHHIPLDHSSIPKTAFISPFGKYKYIKVPFGLAQAPTYFQELMTGILKDFHFAIAYIDNIVIFSKIPKDLSHIKKVFDTLRSAKLSMKLSKCHFFSKEIQYLGHILSTTGIQSLPSKQELFNKCNPPTPKQV